MLRGVRLVSQTTDESFPPDASLRGEPADFAAAALWIRERLQATRSASSIAMLCLDEDGGVCSWVTSPSTDPSVVSAAIRLGTADGARAGGGAFDFYAPSNAESSLEPLAPPTVKAKVAPPRAGRLPVLGIADVPARLLVDALDREGVPVEQACTLWHAMAAAWDPGAPRAGTSAADAPSDAGPITAIVMIDLAGRLVWCWSRGGALLVAGSLRLRARRNEQNPDEPGTLDYGPEDASRLAAEWLSWSVQLARAPRRIVCVLTPSDAAASFGESLGRVWPGAAVDAVRHEDPLGATLRRAADLIESTPRTAAPEFTALQGLSRRPGRSHRRMHHWRAVALLGFAVVLGIGAWQFQSAAAAAEDSAEDWKTRWNEVVVEAYPDMPKGLGEQASPIVQLNNEVRRLERELQPIGRTDQTMPVLQELETISLVLGSASCDLEEIALDSTLRPRVSTIVRTAEQADAILEGFRRIGGSYVTGWSVTATERPQGTEQRIRALYQGEWDRDALKTAGGAP